MSPASTRYGLSDASVNRLDTYIVTIALTLKPDAPSSAGADGMRIGQRGSLLIRPDGSWYDFAGDVAGRGALPLIAHLLDSEQHDVNPASTTRFAQQWLAEHHGEGEFQAAPFDASQVTERAKRNAAVAAQVLRGCQSLSGTAGEVYLRSRDLPPPYPNVVTFYPDARPGESALVGIRSMSDERIVGVQLGYLDPHGKKSALKLNRLSFLSELDQDKRRGSAFRIPATPVPAALNQALGPADADAEDDEVQRIARNARKLAGVLLIVEGLEDALSLHRALPYSAIIGVPGIGALKHQPVEASQPVIVVKDGDAEDAGAVRALSRGIDELLLRRAKVRVTETPSKQNGAAKLDANAILQRDGVEALQKLVLEAVDARFSLRGAIRHLAAMSKDEREQRCAAVAKQYRVSVGYIRQEVAALRAGESLGSTDGFANLVKREPEPWVGSVDLGEVFDNLVGLLKRLLICTEAEYLVIAAWIVHGYIFEQFTYTPRLCIISPEPRCGKTTLINILTRACYRAVQADGLSPAMFTRLKAQVGACTVLLDEMSEALHNSPELDDVLRSGFERGKQVVKLRAMPDGSFVPEAHDVFNPVAIAVLRAPRAALADRCLMIRLQRKRAGVRVERLRRRELREQVTAIADKLARWRLEGGAQLSDDPISGGAGADPIDELTAPLESSGAANDRQIDFSIPLLAIGQALGDRRELLLRQALQTVLGAEGDTPEAIGVLLLQNLRLILDQHRDANPQVPVGELTIASADLVRCLVALPDSPWSGEGAIRPLTQYRLSRLLRPYKVLPRMTGPKQKRVSGYFWLQLSEACEHYASTPPPSQGSHSSHPPDKSTTYADFQGSHQSPGVNPENPLKPAADCGSVRGVNPERGEASLHDISAANPEGFYNPDEKNSSLQKEARNDSDGPSHDVVPPVRPNGPDAPDAGAGPATDLPSVRPTLWDIPSS